MTTIKAKDFCLKNVELISYLKHIGCKKSKFMVNMVANRVMVMDSKDEKKRSFYFKQLDRITKAFIYTFETSPFE